MRTRHGGKPARLVAYVQPQLKQALEREAARQGLSASTLVALVLQKWADQNIGKGTRR